MPPSEHGEHPFQTFVKESVGLVIALAASLPMLFDYLDLIESPFLGSAAKKEFLPILVSIASGLIFLALFWHRHRFTRVRWLLTGVGIAFVGIVALGVYHVESGDQDPAAADRAQAGGEFDPWLVFFYSGGALALVSGVSLVMVHGYTLHGERPQAIGDMVPMLDDTGWEHLQRFASVRAGLASSKGRVHPRALEPLRRGSDELFRQFDERLRALEEGTLEMRGGRIGKVFDLFAETLEHGFRAVSLDDIEYFDSEDSRAYVAANLRLVERGLTVERIFLVPTPLTPRHVAVIRQQVELGIRIRVVPLAAALRLDRGNLHLDFCLFDQSAVGFWRVSPGRLFRVTADLEEARRYDHFFGEIAAICERTPGGEQAFESVADLDRWLSLRSGGATIG